MNKTGPKIAVFGIWVLILVLSVTLAKNVIRSKRIQAQIQAEKDKIAKIKVENTKLEAEIAQTQSAEFLEREMRNKLGLGKAGEVVIVLPDKEVLKRLSPTVLEETEVLPDPNWKRWLKLFY